MHVKDEDGNVIDITQDLRLMSPLELVRFCRKAITETPRERIIHGMIIQKDQSAYSDEGQWYRVDGFCGCAIGTVALADGAAAQAQLQEWRPYGTSTYDWVAGAFAGWLLASMSRCFELGATMNRQATVADIARVINRLDLCEKALLGNTAHTQNRDPRSTHHEPSAFYSTDKHFGSLELYEPRDDD